MLESSSQRVSKSEQPTQEEETKAPHNILPRHNRMPRTPAKATGRKCVPPAATTNRGNATGIKKASVAASKDKTTYRVRIIRDCTLYDAEQDYWEDSDSFGGEPEVCTAFDDEEYLEYDKMLPQVFMSKAAATKAAKEAFAYHQGREHAPFGSEVSRMVNGEKVVFFDDDEDFEATANKYKKTVCWGGSLLAQLKLH